MFEILLKILYELLLSCTCWTINMYHPGGEHFMHLRCDGVAELLLFVCGLPHVTQPPPTILMTISGDQISKLRN